jgi:hypothetical protein
LEALKKGIVRKHFNVTRFLALAGAIRHIGPIGWGSQGGQSVLARLQTGEQSMISLGPIMIRFIILMGFIARSRKKLESIGAPRRSFGYSFPSSRLGTFVCEGLLRAL